MALDPLAAVGQGVLSASELVRAARHVMQRRIATRMSVDDDGNEHAADGKFTGPGTGGEKAPDAEGKQTEQTGAKSNPTKPKSPRKLKGTHDSVEQLVDDSLNGSGNQKFFDFSHVNEEEVELLREAFGVDASRFVHSMAESDIRHALRRHDSGSTQAEDLVPITIDDIKKVPEIIATADRVKATDDGTHKGLIYSKRVNGTIVLVQVVASRKEKLRFKTMRKHRAKESE